MSVKYWVISLISSFCGILMAGDYCRDFREHNSFAVYPGKYKTNWKKNTPDGGHLIKDASVNRTQALSAIGTIPFPEGTAQIEGEVRYRSITRNNSPVNLSMTLFFNKKGMGNGSAGKTVLSIPDAPEWKEFRFTVNVPGMTERCMFVFTINGIEGELILQQLRFRYVKDHVSCSISPSSFDWKVRPSTWKDAARITHFYNSSSGELAKTQTDFRITCDRNYLYAGFTVFEPCMADIVAKHTGYDAPVWNDDCVELFLFESEKNRGYQFVVNSTGCRYDGELRQRQTGDPFTSHKEWNAKWDAVTFRNPDSWEVSIRIPWKTLGYDTIPSGTFCINAARERKTYPEISHCGAYTGNLQDVLRYSRLILSNEELRLVRSRETTKVSFVPVRKKPAFAELLSGGKGNYIVGAWTQGFYKCQFPDSFQKKYPDEVFNRWKWTMLDTWAQAGMCGPIFPWAVDWYGGTKAFHEYHRKNNMIFPYALFGGHFSRQAFKFGPEYTNAGRVDTADPAYIKAVEAQADVFIEWCRNPENRKLAGFIVGIDEPSNCIYEVFSRSVNTSNPACLDKADADIRKTTGFGKFGLYDEFGLPDAETPFRRIAFWRWWNNRSMKYHKAIGGKLHEALPEIAHIAFNRNTCTGICDMDMALHSPYAQFISCDPYPTSALAFYGMGRALYHTGFNVKIIADLARKSKVAVMPQCFTFHGRRPEPEDLREWFSQALKNGAEIIYWYTETDSILEMRNTYNAMLNLNRDVAVMNQLILPTETGTAILYSDYDRWGLNDKSVHASYSVYSILGEHLKSWFRFVSPTGLNSGIQPWAGCRLLIVPRMRFTDPETTRKLVGFVENGGTLLVLDPNFLKYNLDASAPPERLRLLGTTLRKREETSGILLYGKEKLKTTKVFHLSVPECGQFDAWDFETLPSDTQILARYEDGKPAIIERRIGKGRLIFSAVLPFGNSDAAIKPEGWKTFFADVLKSIGEKTGLKIWDFVLPGTNGKIAVQPPF